jgi:serine protease Do
MGKTMTKKRFSILLLFSLLMAFVLAACGGDEPEVGITPEALPTSATQATVPPADPTAETAASGAVMRYQDVVNALVQIEAQGSFVDPEFGMMLNTAGRGSGFIIDPSGIAVTNNHVVTGAAFLQVWIGGEGEPRNARILGASECSDLAVIDIDGEGFPYLEWSTTPPTLGTEVYAAGFPLGDPEPTLTRGIVSKEEADGESNWASVDNVIEHDATINPGNSGGPLVTADGKAIGVNYAGSAETNQYFSITAGEAIPVIEQLRAGTDLNSIGVNGTAINDGEGLSGIWVASVKSGSPADTTGIQAGDIITSLEGLILSTDGTMADYCDILRSRNMSDTMAVEVLRFETSEVMEGQLNGRELEMSFSFAQEVGEEVVAEGEQTTETYTSYVQVQDDSGAMVMEVPAEWSQVDGSNWVDSESGEVLGGALTASTDLEGWRNSYDIPGVQMLASTQLANSNMGELLDTFNFSEGCTYDSRTDYSDPVFTGQYDLYVNCTGVGSSLIVLAAEPADRSYAVVIIAQLITSADFDALDQVLNTFNVVGTLPG